MYIILIISIIIPIIIIIIGNLLNNREINKREITVYECGFQPKKLNYENQNINIVKIGMYYLIFDLEIIYYYPYIDSNKYKQQEIEYIILTIGLIIIIIWEDSTW